LGLDIKRIVAFGPRYKASGMWWAYFITPTKQDRLQHTPQHSHSHSSITTMTSANPNASRRWGLDIVFRQHNRVPENFKKLWQNLLRTCAFNPNVIVKLWLDKLRNHPEECHDGDGGPYILPRHTDLVLLERAEGGIGGSDNTCRQIRFSGFMMHTERQKDKKEWVPPWCYDEIKLCATGSADGTDVWEPRQLRVYRDAFSEVICEYVGVEAHEKRIEIVV